MKWRGSNHVNFQDALEYNLRALVKDGREISPRGMKTKELLLHSFTVARPTERISIIPERRFNPFAQVAETLWMLAGRDDMEFLENYIPQAPKFSDDGETWRGAYGPRLRRWRDVYGDVRYDEYDYIDQLREVMGKLLKSPNTRQAIVSLWDPARDWVRDSKDYPCNNWLHFIIRDGRLHLNVAVRSNDVIYGFSHVDFFGWSVLLEAMAFWTGTDVGRIGWTTTSFHLYQRHFELAMDIIDNDLPETPYQRGFHPPKFTTMWTDFDDVLTHFFEKEGSYRTPTKARFPIGVYECRFMNTALQLAWLWNRLQQFRDGRISKGGILDAIAQMPSSDLKMSALAYMIPIIGDSLVLKDTEERYLRDCGVV